MILFLFAALLLIMFIPVYLYMYNFALNNEFTYIYYRFHSGVSSLDTVINGVNNIAVFTNRDSRFDIFSQDRQYLGKDPVLLNELRSYFNSVLLSHPLIEDAGIIFSPDLVLTRGQIFYSPMIYPFYGNYIQCNDVSMDEWFALISVTNTLAPVQHYTSISNGSYEALTYSVRWKAREGSNLNILYSTLPVKRLLSQLADDEVLSKSSLRIYDNKNDIIYQHYGEKWNPKERFRTLTDKCGYTQVFFEILVQESVISGKMLPVKRLMLVFALITVFFALCLSLSFAYKWSEPMRRLLRNIDSTKLFKSEYEQTIKQADFGWKNFFRRPYTDLSDSISAVDNRLEDSLRTIEGQTSLLREQVFYKTLFQGIYSEQDEQLFRSLFTGFPVLFQLALISYDMPSETFLRKTAVVRLQLIDAVKMRIGNIYIHSVGDNIIILLLPLAEKNEFWHERLQDLRNSLNQEIDLALRFSLSGIFERPSDLNRAWQELQSIHIASGIENLVSVVQIKDLPNPKKHMPFTVTTLQMIYNALNNGNDDTACTILAECTADIFREKDMFVMGLLSNLLHDLLVLLKSENPGIPIDEEIPQYIRGREDTLLNTQFPECFSRFGKFIRHYKEELIIQFSNKLLEYINLNLYNPALYSTMVQDEFNISQPTLQKLIKEMTGHTFLSYVESCRLAKARELLLEGACTIQEVSMQCGFSNMNSFYKAFRRVYGFPPSDIRNNSRASVSKKD